MGIWVPNPRPRSNPKVSEYPQKIESRPNLFWIFKKEILINIYFFFNSVSVYLIKQN